VVIAHDVTAEHELHTQLTFRATPGGPAS
jgi:hypothetical protein